MDRLKKEGPAAMPGASRSPSIFTTAPDYAAARSLPRGRSSMPPFSLSNAQLDAIYDAARPLQPIDRSRFLEDVAAELAGCPDVGDGQLARIVRQVQKRYFRPPQLAESGKYR
jgi:hypothetical protein